MNLKAGIGAGLIAGLVFLIAEMVLVGTVGGQSPWGPPRMIAAIGMGEDVLPPPATFDAGIVMVAMLIHFALAAVLGVLFAVLIGRFVTSTVAALATGAVFGLVVYFVNFYGLTGMFPWFAMARNGISIFAHVLFGVVLAWSYRRLTAKPA